MKFNFIFIMAVLSTALRTQKTRVLRLTCCALALAAMCAAQENDNASANHGTPQVPANPQTFLSHPDNRLWFSAQVNAIFQAHPAFHSQYSGVNSLDPHYEKALSHVMTFFSGMRIDDSTELLTDFESAGGRGLSNALGLAGFTNLDVVRNPSLGQAPYLARFEVHKVIALSDKFLEVDRGVFSGFSRLPEQRLEIRVGRLSLADFFDLNTEASDSHFQFMNWASDNNAAYDYAADTRGYTYAAMVDYERPAWSFRVAEALLPTVANGIKMNWSLAQSHSENYEFTLKRLLCKMHGGVLRVLAFHNTANMGIYDVAVQRYLEGLDRAPDITAHPVQTTTKYGFGLNFEQSVTPSTVIFGRFGWNNGKTESYVYTEADQTASVGAAFYGMRWGRPHDKAGVAFVSNAISADHRRYLELGGRGFLLGDGGLSYGRENILEAYYTCHVWRGAYFGPDLQHLNNPGYNRSRGPVLVPGFRMHLEF